MDISIVCNFKKLRAYAVIPDKSNTCVLFLSGGSVKTGKERYKEWQDRLGLIGISSASFDYSGVNDSGLQLKQSSLYSRIEEAVCVADWLTEHAQPDQYMLYGVSMGGYIALGLVNKKPDMFKKLILHAPAAYSPRAHDICFGKKFTDEIKKKNGWQNSLSFEWMEKYKKPILLIRAEDDEIIPDQIIEKYKEMGSPKVLILKGAKHDVWNDTPENINFREEIYKHLEKFCL